MDGDSLSLIEGNDDGRSEGATLGNGTVGTEVVTSVGLKLGESDSFTVVSEEGEDDKAVEGTALT